MELKKKDGQMVLEPPDDPKDFLTRLAPELDQMVTYDFVVPTMSDGKPLNKDSTNMNPTDWKLMADTVKMRMRKYDGFVIAHGTDTMHFSATALAFAFGENLNFPIVFTGAQTNPSVAHGDARINLVRACKVAGENLAEVVICFDDNIFRGCRCQKKDEKRFDAFESPAFSPIGYMGESIESTSDWRRKRPDRGLPDYEPDFEEGIFVVTLIPGLEPEFIETIVEKESCKALILQSFGAGNVPTYGDYSFIPLIKKATDKRKPVVIASQFPGHSARDSIYETGVEAHKAGGILTGNMTSAAAVVKLRWALRRKEVLEGNPEERVQDVGAIMQRPYVGEMDPIQVGD